MRAVRCCVHVTTVCCARSAFLHTPTPLAGEGRRRRSDLEVRLAVILAATGALTVMPCGALALGGAGDCRVERAGDRINRNLRRAALTSDLWVNDFDMKPLAAKTILPARPADPKHSHPSHALAPPTARHCGQLRHRAVIRQPAGARFARDFRAGDGGCWHGWLCGQGERARCIHNAQTVVYCQHPCM